jgi:hypothetical protein
MTGGRLKLEVLAAGSVVPAFQMQDAVNAGILDGGHGVTAYWYGKNKAFSLFGTVPAFGWDANNFMSWMNYGGGYELYNELVNGILKLNLVGFVSGPMPCQPLGWFKKEVKTAGRPEADQVPDRRSGRRSVQGAWHGRDDPARRRNRAGAGARGDRRSGVQQSVLRLAAGLPGRVEGLHAAAITRRRVLRDHSQQGQVRRAQPAEVKAIVKYAAESASSDMLWKALDRYSKDLEASRPRVST